MKNMVSLVGAGVGSWDMISLRAMRCIETADVLIYDRLLDDRLLDLAPDTCEMIYVGKAAGHHYMKQDDINSLIAQKAISGGHVVRLKGGDPYVFGRGGEEALFLQERGIAFQVVPGISSAVAGACFAGIPVTHRELAREFHVITAHTKSGGLETADYKRLSVIEGTIVFLMGLSQASDISAGLISAGKNADCPVAVISCAGSAHQKTVCSTLKNLAEDISDAELPSPAIIVVGETVTLRDSLNFFENRPLFGKRILLTHSSRRDDYLRETLEQFGASADVSPMIEIRPRGGVIDQSKLSDYSYIVFTSINAVDCFMKDLWNSGADIRSIHAASIAVVGSATAKKLESYGLRADILPEEFTAQALAKRLLSVLSKNDRVLLPQAAMAEDTLYRALSDCCATERVEMYDTVMPESVIDGAAFENANYDAVCFASSSAVNNFDKCVGLDRLRESGCAVFAIGIATAQTLRQNGIEPHVGAKSNFEGLAQAVIDYYSEAE